MQTAIEQMAYALEIAIPRLCQGCEFMLPFAPESFEAVGVGGLVRGVGEGNTHIYPRGGAVECLAAKQRAALDRYRNDPETLLKEAGKARRELGERVRDGK